MRRLLSLAILVASFGLVALSAETSAETYSETFPAVNSAILGTCTAAAHNRYSVTGPDGKLYRTWHPIVDPVTHCTFAHEHGDILPAGAPQPPFGYAAEVGRMPSEIGAHSGFKVYAHSPGNISGFNAPEADYRGVFDGKFYFVIHQGSAGAGRLTTRYHGTQFWSFDPSNGNTTNVYAMADTGALHDLCDPKYPAGPVRDVASDGCAVYESWSFPVDIGGAWSVQADAAITYPMNHMHGTPPCVDAGCSNITLTSSSQTICNNNLSPCAETRPFGSPGGLWYGHIRTLHDPNWVWTNSGGAGKFCTNAFGVRQDCSVAGSISQTVPSINLDNGLASMLLRTENAAGFDAVMGALDAVGAPGGN